MAKQEKKDNVKENPESVDTETKTEKAEKEAVKPKQPTPLPFDEWGVKKKDQTDVRKAFESFVGLKPEDVMAVITDSKSYPGKIIFLKHRGPNQKLVCNR